MDTKKLKISSQNIGKHISWACALTEVLSKTRSKLQKELPIYRTLYLRGCHSITFLSYPMANFWNTALPFCIHKSCYWPVVQQWWSDSAIPASERGMAWAAKNHHPISLQRSYKTGPNIFSATLPHSEKSMKQPSIHPALGNFYTFLWGIWRW
jgi:hypothetical protein